jgi:hypothetical protein
LEEAVVVVEREVVRRGGVRGEVVVMDGVVMGDEVVVKGRWVVVRGRRAMGGRRQ